MMLNAWHLPVPPFVKQSKDQLLITLWLTSEDPPQRIMPVSYTHLPASTTR